jgi:hypothetical protein
VVLFADVIWSDWYPIPDDGLRELGIQSDVNVVVEGSTYNQN